MAASVVLNGATSSARVSQTTRERILEAAARLRYRRNVAALGLSRRRMNTLGVVSTIVGRTVNLYYMEVLTGLLASAAEHGQSVSILTVRDWAADETRILEFCDGRIDGLILIGPELSPAFARLLVQYAPLVSLHGTMSVPLMPTIDIDNEGGSYLATRHLIELGHRRLVHLAGPPHTESGRLRLNGFRRALVGASLPISTDISRSGTFVYESGYNRTAAMLDFPAGREMPTGFVCANDASAFGCIDALRERGLSIPDDVSVVGFDDTMLARMMRPTLTTIHQPFGEMCQRAVQVLLEQIHADLKSEDRQAGSELVFPEYKVETWPAKLVMGESTAHPKS